MRLSALGYFLWIGDTMCCGIEFLWTLLLRVTKSRLIFVI